MGLNDNQKQIVKSFRSNRFISSLPFVKIAAICVILATPSLLLFVLKLPFMQVFGKVNSGNYQFLSLGFETNAAIYPKKTAAAIPAEPAVRPPVKAPMRPFSFTASRVPFAMV